MKKILLAEDDKSFGLMLKAFLEMHTFEVLLCENGLLAIEALENTSFDLCILDIMMPHADGFSVAEKIIKRTAPLMPFVFLSAKALKEDQIKGYQLGAADYLIKPFDPEILLFKIERLINQHTQQTSNTHTFIIGNFSFDYPKRLLKLKEKQEKLSPKEAELLYMLCQKQGQVLTHEEALIKIWKSNDYFSKQSMNVYITKLRKYLSQDSAYHIQIENIHSSGFILKF